jgi:hypothetical protein
VRPLAKPSSALCTAFKMRPGRIEKYFGKKNVAHADLGQTLWPRSAQIRARSIAPLSDHYLQITSVCTANVLLCSWHWCSVTKKIVHTLQINPFFVISMPPLKK